MVMKVLSRSVTASNMRHSGKIVLETDTDIGSCDKVEQTFEFDI